MIHTVLSWQKENKLRGHKCLSLGKRQKQIKSVEMKLDLFGEDYSKNILTVKTAIMRTREKNV